MQEFSTQSGILQINLQAISDNYSIFKNTVGEGKEVAGVLKANAYGLGLEAIVKKLTALNCPQFFVATLEEAIALRKVNTSTPVAVLGGLFTGAERDYLQNNILPVLNTPEEIERWNNIATKHDQKLPAIIHFDTGMNRLGLSADEAQKFINQQSDYNAINIQLIMSHFACADEKDHPLTQKQANDFSDIAKYFPNAKKSLANSPGLFRDSSYHHDMARPGFSLYGGNPTPETANPMNRVVSLNTRILQIRHVKKGESIGYGAHHVFDKDTVTATIACGYADGFLRSGSGKATVYYDEKACPVLGRVSMDLITIEIGHLEKQPEIGSAIEILGPNQSVDDLADACGTIGYEILTSLGQRYQREYI